MIGKGKGVKSGKFRRGRRGRPPTVIIRDGQPGENNLPLFAERYIDRLGPLNCDICDGSGFIPGKITNSILSPQGDVVGWEQTAPRICSCSTPTTKESRQ